MRDFLNEPPIKVGREHATSSSASFRPFLLAVIFCLLAGLLVYLDHQGSLMPARSVLQQVVTPITGRLLALRDGVSDVVTAPRMGTDLQARITTLEQANSQLNEALLRLKQAEVENAFLRQQLAIQRDRPWHLLGAEVMVRSPDAGRRVIMLARGTDDGLRPGMAVVGQLADGPAALVGIIESVGPHAAEVLLITDIGSQVSGRIIHAGQAAVGLVQGQWQKGSRLHLDQIERSMPIASGDPVVTAGLTAALSLPFDLAAVPAEIPIGTVEQVGVTEQYQHAELRPFVDPDQVRYVWVILSQDA